MKSDAEIAALQHLLAIEGNEDAYRRLYLLLAPSLFHFARAIVKTNADAEDIVSDVFVKLWEKRQTLDHIQNLRLYLFVATRNFAINRYKQIQAERKLAFESLQGADLLLTEHLADIADAADMEGRMQQAIQDLPPRCRAVYTMVRSFGLRQKEVAELMHLAPKTVENQMAIALKKLGEAFLRLKKS